MMGGMSIQLPILRSDRRRTYEATPGQTVFALDVPIFDLADIAVSVRAPTDRFFAVITAGYTAAFVGPQQHAQVTFDVPPVPSTGGPDVVVQVESKRID